MTAINPNQKYFNRVQGPWGWSVHFELGPIRELLTSSIRWDHKIRTMFMVLIQMISGPFTMKTEVELESSANQALHHLQIIKWGVVFYRSEKRITLHANGFDLNLDGEEFYWPFLNMAQPFKNYKARVDENHTSAKYEWPLFGARVHCETQLGTDQGLIHLQAGWLSCTYQLDTVSMQELGRRA